MMTSNKFAKVLVLTIAGTAMVAPTLGSAKERGPRINFEMLDTDKSGEITRAEMEAAGAVRFARADADGDGFLTKEELSKEAGERAQRRMERMFERRDANSDGKLSAEELRPNEERVAKRFSKLDADKSGGISKAEFDAMKAARKDRRKSDSE
ncbi:MAG: calcium-binding protein [Pseudomonadota bacterium]